MHPPSSPPTPQPTADGMVADALFDTALCLNCGATLTGPFCAQCGQKKAGRIGRATVRQEAWARFRWFEWGVVRNALRVLPQPGTMAREYVLGMRKDHLHPLSLLCLAIGFLLVVLGHTDYLKPELPSEAAARMYALVASYSKWSFSLGALAAFASAAVVFWRRRGYNAAELLAFALVCQAVFIALQILNQLPLVLAPSPGLLKWHKAWSPWYMTGVQALVFMVALCQFYLVDLRREGWRLLLAGALFALLKWQTTALYARAVVELVLWQMGL
ncbi:hypothetical protein HNP48_004765 [Acidovorax soli]|uniref:DUF3667 domain-containing protein n=1 Tax=Acidovorax soli TaxID=592050 RepID=A0A7X0PII8_9BURK|nr:DUF3667 domain-containing protein [Acidovorax soli]MBB6562056.1 hypothetical protein [Acidovorax soli]